MTKQLYTCPCCGYLSLDDSPGSYDICHICFWEDDPVQMLDPWFSGGANKPSLVLAQNTFISTGACDTHGKKFVKGIQSGDIKDPQWRPVRESDRSFVKRPREIKGRDWKNLDTWYYWRHGDA
jgi:hypothetical protein